MNTRLIAFLFTALFIIGAFPLFLLQPLGPADAGVTAGFMLPLQDLYHVVFTAAIGLISAWLGSRALLLLPLCALLMMCTGGLMEVSAQSFPAIHGFILGAILLFAACVSMLRSITLLLWMPPIAVFSYFAGGDFIRQVPAITTPLFFLIGIILCSTLLLAVGVALGMTLGDRARESMNRFKSSTAFTAFIGFF